MEEDNIRIQQHSKKDKFHLIRVPKGFDITKLNGVEYDPHQILEIEAQKDKNGLVNVFELGTFAGQKMDLNLLVKSENTVKVGPALNRNLFVTKSVRLDTTAPQTSNKVLQSFSKGPVCLPDGLKERFTPFGSSSPVVRRKKRKRSHALFEESFSQSKKRQKCSTTEDDKSTVDGNANSFMIQDSDSVKKHKKRKHKSDAFFSVNGFSPGKYSKKIKQEMSSSMINDSDEAGNSVLASGDDGKIHKKKKKHSLSICDTTISDPEYLSETSPKNKKKKKKKDKV